MTRVVHVINSLARIGGAERLILDLVECSKARPVPVITWWGRDNSLINSANRGSIDLIALRPFRWKALRRAFRALRQAQVVHLHLFPTLYLGPFINRPILYTEHNTWNARRDRPLLRPLERWCYSRIDKVVAISKETATALSCWLGKDPPGLSVIPNGVRLSRFDNVPKQHHEGAMILGMAARFAVEKDHRTLIEAMSHLPQTYSLRLAGDGKLLEEMKSFARQLGVFDRIEFAGVLQDMPGFYRGLDLYVQSSKFDGFSLVALEAMASGLPALVSDIDGLRSTVGNRQLLFPPADAHALAARIREICQNRELYESLAVFCSLQS
jgi:glycosyltransferase involved in cell wall biosynthesis